MFKDSGCGTDLKRHRRNMIVGCMNKLDLNTLTNTKVIDILITG